MTPPSLTERSLTSTAWQLIASLFEAAVLLVRSILLARLLPVEVFGIFAFATSLVNWSGVFASFGLGEAFLHRADETQDEGQAASAHFTLNLVFTLLWLAGLEAVALLFFEGPQRTALVVVTLAVAGLQLTQTPQLILTRRVAHRRLAFLRFANSILTSIISVFLAWKGYNLWALLAAPLVTTVLFNLLLFGWRPVWLPRLTWPGNVIRYFLDFGLRQTFASFLLKTLDEVDDIWTGAFLGQTALGFYSRAYTFATYPRRLLAHPVSSVAAGVYAELKDRREQLSQAFFWTNALLVRSGFLFAGGLVLTAPEFIQLFLGARWLPMLLTFQLMLVFTLLDPVLFTASSLFSAVGRPEILTQARLVQLVLLISGMVLFGSLLGIAGIALAVDLMLLAGLLILFSRARRFIDFSLMRLFGPPGIALIAGLLVALGSLRFLPPIPSDWVSAAVKLVAFSAIYLLGLGLIERKAMLEMVSILPSILRKSRNRLQRPFGI